jgi:hypothetical protein
MFISSSSKYQGQNIGPDCRQPFTAASLGEIPIPAQWGRRSTRLALALNSSNAKVCEEVPSPAAGLEAYAQNDSKDLGDVFQFRFSLEGAYEFEDRSRTGLRLSHISNAGINGDDPGEESALVTYSIPLTF